MLITLKKPIEPPERPAEEQPPLVKVLLGIIERWVKERIKEG
jgi:hypothetical protein